MSDVKKDYIQLVAETTDKDYDSIKILMDNAQKYLGVTYAEYYDNKLYEMTYTQQCIMSKRILTRRNNRKKRFEQVSKYTGLTPKQIYGKIREINNKNIVRMTLVLYAKYEVYRFEGEKLDEFLYLLARRNDLKDRILAEFEKIDNGQISYSDVQPLLDELYDVISKIMPESIYESFAEAIEASQPHLKENEEECRRIAIDMEVLRVLLQFSQAEYIAFNFCSLELSQKREFISDSERMKVLNVINDPSKFDVLDNKLEGYQVLSDYYDREIISVKSKSDYEKFESFCKKHGTIVVKSPCETLGRGIRAVNITPDTDLEELFDSIIDGYNDMMIEQLIIAHDSIRDLNPDSVNTIRMITYYDGEKSIIHDTFMKVGQKGSFIDNGGAGGILVSVDKFTGQLNSDGCDERGVIYKEHPYTGRTFNGYQLPDWEQAIELGLELSDKIPGLNYIGWDITYTADNKWIVVEGNAKTQFFGQQCTRGKGVRKDFLKTVNYNE